MIVSFSASACKQLFQRKTPSWHQQDAQPGLAELLGLCFTHLNVAESQDLQLLVIFQGFGQPAQLAFRQVCQHRLFAC